MYSCRTPSSDSKGLYRPMRYVRWGCVRNQSHEMLWRWMASKRLVYFFRYWRQWGLFSFTIPTSLSLWIWSPPMSYNPPRLVFSLLSLFLLVPDFFVVVLLPHFSTVYLFCLLRLQLFVLYLLPCFITLFFIRRNLFISFFLFLYEFHFSYVFPSPVPSSFYCFH